MSAARPGRAARLKNRLLGPWGSHPRLEKFPPGGFIPLFCARCCALVVFLGAGLGLGFVVGLGPGLAGSWGPGWGWFLGLGWGSFLGPVLGPFSGPCFGSVLGWFLNLQGAVK